jgi:hypothetical protein
MLYRKGMPVLPQAGGRVGSDENPFLAERLRVNLQPPGAAARFQFNAKTPRWFGLLINFNVALIKFGIKRRANTS